MVGQGALRACLLDPEVSHVLVVGRAPTGKSDPKLREEISQDLFDLGSIDLSGQDACFFCLGVSSAGMSEPDYRRITYDLTLHAAKAIVEKSPQCVFIYVSGVGTGGKSMWGRVKGETEDALLALPFRAAYMFRPGYIQPVHGAKSKTRLYRALYAVSSPFFPVLKALFPAQMTTNETVALAMLEAAKHGAPKKKLEPPDINELAKKAG